jgi:hypothetical protein
MELVEDFCPTNLPIFHPEPTTSRGTRKPPPLLAFRATAQTLPTLGGMGRRVAKLKGEVGP